MISTLKDGPLAVIILAGIALVGIVVLACLNRTVPAELWGLEAALVGGGLGITNPTSSSSSSSSPAAGPGVPVDQAGGVAA